MQMNAGSEATTPTPADSTLVSGPVTPTPISTDTATDMPVMPVMPSLDTEAPSEEFAGTEPAQLINKEQVLARKAQQKERLAEIASRSPVQAAPVVNPAAAGNPQATVSDPLTAQVIPRYDIVQNRSDKFLIIADLKTMDVDDPGETMNPGACLKLTDFYSPQQINRSKGLRYAATKLKGVGDNMALVPLASEEQAADFTPPQKKVHEPGTTLIDNEPNDFDLRFEELQEKEKKREERLKKKSLGMRRTSKHGSVPVV